MNEDSLFLPLPRRTIRVIPVSKTVQRPEGHSRKEQHSFLGESLLVAKNVFKNSQKIHAPFIDKTQSTECKYGPLEFRCMYKKRFETLKSQKRSHIPNMLLRQVIY